MSTAPLRADVFERLKIAVRERPLGEEEKASVQVMLRTDNDKLIAFYPDSKEGLVYNYDYFFPEEATQLDLFQSIGLEMVDLVMAGFSSSCVTFGFSATGKTHSLFGSDQEPGLIQLTTKELFHRTEALAQTDEYRISFSYWEMNCDQIVDALSQGGSEEKTAFNVRRGEEGVHVTNLTRLEVNSWDELDEGLMRGNIKRIQLSEARNARWHGFVKVYIDSIDRATGGTLVSRTMTFAHLKGPDRVGQKGARGDVLKHGSNINKSVSLFCAAILHAVDFRRRGIKDVATEEQHQKLIERSQSFFMESKFTQILSQCITGLESCFMIGCVCALDYHETTDTLENLQNAQQLTAALRRRSSLTEQGKVQKKLAEAEAAVPKSQLAVGHPLNELEERVARLRAKLGAEEEDEAAPKLTLNKLLATSAGIAAMDIPETLQKWKQSVLLGKIHGDRSKIYIPTADKEQPNTYQGQWAKGRKEGVGEHITEKTRYVGEWKSGMRDGDGTLWTRPHRDAPWTRIYKGAWRQDKRHGRGINFYSNGDVYDGFFEDGLRSALGKLFLANGDRIEGQFRNDKTEGWATLYRANGDWHEGYWLGGLREGPGVWYFATKQQCLKGEWHKNICKCGVMEDLPNKETNANSNFMPRVELVDYRQVLAGERQGLNELRLQEQMNAEAIFGSTGEGEEGSEQVSW
jgi:hypothetical protein